MNHSKFALLIAATMALGTMGFGAALAQDEPSNASSNTSVGDQTTPQKPDQKQFMKDCMTKAKASNNGMSEKDMKKACQEQLKANMGSPSQPVTPAH